MRSRSGRQKLGQHTWSCPLVIAGMSNFLLRALDASLCSCRHFFSAVPQLEDVLDNATLSKAAKATKTGKGKKKEAGNSTPIQQVDMTSFAMGSSDLAPGIVPITAAPTSTEGSPAPQARTKPAFARIGGADDAGSTPSHSGYATPLAVVNGGDRTKVKIGFGVKRKGVDDDRAPTPSAKRR